MAWTSVWVSVDFLDWANDICVILEGVEPGMSK